MTLQHEGECMHLRVTESYCTGNLRQERVVRRAGELDLFSGQPAVP